MPISQINPDGTVKIYNSQTGEQKDVKPEELKDYNPALVGDYQKRINESSSASTYAEGIIGGTGTDIAKVPEGIRDETQKILNEKKYTPEDVVAKRKDGQAMKALEGFIKTLDDLKKESAEVGVKDIVAGAVGLSSKSENYERKKGLAGRFLARLVENGRITKDDADFYQDKVVNIKSVGLQGPKDESIDDLKRTVVQLAGFNPDEVPGVKKNETINNTTQPPKNNKNVGEFVGNAVQDVKEMGEGLLALPQLYNEMNPTTIGNDILGIRMPDIQKQAEVTNAVVKGTVDEYGKLISNPTEHAYDNPVDTILDLLPFAPLGKAGFTKFASSGKVAEEAGIAGKVAETAKVADDVAGAGKEASLLNKASQKTAEFLNGAGPKEFIAQNVNLDGAKDLQRTILDKNIYSKVSTKGKIEATQKALTQTGLDLEKTLKNSPEKVSAYELTNSIERQLLDNFGESYAPVIKDIKNAIVKNGEFTLGTGDVLLDMVKINKMKTAMMDYGLRSLKLGENGKAGAAIAEETARVLRDLVAKKVPEATPYLRDYRNLRVYMEILPDATGVQNMGAVQSLVSKLNLFLDAGKQPLNKLNQVVYNKTPKEVMPDLATSQVPSSAVMTQTMPPMQDITDTIVGSKNTMPDMSKTSSVERSKPAYVNSKEIRYVKDAKGKPVQQMKDSKGNWVEYKPSVKNFKKD